MAQKRNISEISKTKLKCYVCFRTEQDEYKLGEFIIYNDNFCVHYNCLLLGVFPQNGKDTDGIYGFLIEDIKKLIKSYTKTCCYYCQKKRATSKCCYKKCKIVFHVSCALLKNCHKQNVNDNFYIYCVKHSKEILSDINKEWEHLIKIQAEEKLNKLNSFQILTDTLQSEELEQCKTLLLNRKFEKFYECKLCLNDFKDNDDFIILPCCWHDYGLRDNFWEFYIHKSCLNRYAFNAGYKFRCPMCKDSKTFLPYIMKMGIFILERHALWEDSSIENRSLVGQDAHCEAIICSCPNGRNYQDEDISSSYCILICFTCGSSAIHRFCLIKEKKLSSNTVDYQCAACTIDSKRIDNSDNPDSDMEKEILVHNTDSEPELTVDDLFAQMGKQLKVPKPIELPPRRPNCIIPDIFRNQCKEYAEELRREEQEMQLYEEYLKKRFSETIEIN